MVKLLYILLVSKLQLKTFESQRIKSVFKLKDIYQESRPILPDTTIVDILRENCK